MSITGVVTGDFQENDEDQASNLGGFYLQSESPDDKPETSDGIFVFDGNEPRNNVNVGDRVSGNGNRQGVLR